MTVATFPTAGNHPRKLGKRESKVIEAAKSTSYSTITGDITINSSGVAALGSGVIIDADVSATAAIALNKLVRATGDAGKFLVCAATTGIVTSVAMSGDATLASTGAVTIGANKIRPLMVAAADGTANQVLTTNGSNVFSFASAVVAETVATTVVLSDVDVKALNSTPIQLIAAPAAGSYVEIIQVELLSTGTTGYDGVAAGEDLTIQYSSGSVIATVETAGWIDQAAAAARVVHPVATAVIPAVATAVTIANSGPVFAAAGDHGLKVRVRYRTLTALT